MVRIHSLRPFLLYVNRLQVLFHLKHLLRPPPRCGVHRWRPGCGPARGLAAPGHRDRCLSGCMKSDAGVDARRSHPGPARLPAKRARASLPGRPRLRGLHVVRSCHTVARRRRGTGVSLRFPKFLRIFSKIIGESWRSPGSCPTSCPTSACEPAPRRDVGLAPRTAVAAAHRIVQFCRPGGALRAAAAPSGTGEEAQWH